MDYSADNLELLGAGIWTEPEKGPGGEAPGQPSAGGCLVVPKADLPVLGDPQGLTDLTSLPEGQGWFTAENADPRPLAVEKSQK
jgi:hypothetical protein